MCGTLCIWASCLSCMPGSSSCCASLGGQAWSGSVSAPIHTVVTRSSMTLNPSCTRLHAHLAQFTICRLCPWQWETATQTSVHLEQTQTSFRQQFGACEKRKGDLEWAGGGIVGIFGEMCSYKVRNVNLNFGGGIWGLGGRWGCYPCIGLLQRNKGNFSVNHWVSSVFCDHDSPL